MTREASRLLEEALELNAGDLREAWAAEIKRRLADADADPSNDEDWRVAVEDIRREVLSR